MRTIHSYHFQKAENGTGITNFEPTPYKILIYEAAVAIFNLQQNAEVLVVSDKPLIGFSVPTDYSLHKIKNVPLKLDGFWKIHRQLSAGFSIEFNDRTNDLSNQLNYYISQYQNS